MPYLPSTAKVKEQFLNFGRGGISLTLAGVFLDFGSAANITLLHLHDLLYSYLVHAHVQHVHVTEYKYSTCPHVHAHVPRASFLART